MVSEEQLAGGRSAPRRQRRGICRRRWWPGSEVAAATPSLPWKQRGGDSTLSARKLAASLWRHLAAISNSGGLSFDRLGFEFCSLAPIPKSAAEGVTKWDYCNSKAWDNHFENSVACTREADSFKARKRVDRNEADGKLMKMKSDERCSEIKNLADGVKRERKICRNMDLMKSGVVGDIAEVKLSATRFVRNLEREKKAREDLEEVCENLAKEIEGSKAQIGELMKQQKRIEMQVAEERKMLQIAEVWREERLQMKIADARLILEDKYAEISNLIAGLEGFLRRLNLINHGDDNNISEVSEISAAKRKGSSGSENQRALSRTCKNIMMDESSDRLVPSIVPMASEEGVSGERQAKVERNPHVVRAMKGHIEWPAAARGIPRRSLPANRLKATLESQKTLLRNVLKQRN